MKETVIAASNLFLIQKKAMVQAGESEYPGSLKIDKFQKYLERENFVDWRNSGPVASSCLNRR